MKRYIVGGLAAVFIFMAVIIVYDRHTIVEFGPAPPDSGWDAGDVAHLLPTVNHTRILIKASFSSPLTNTPLLSVDGKEFAGHRTDSRGYFWWFDATGLEPNTTYELALLSDSGEALCERWPLKTFPAPDDRPERLRLLIYTGFGGHDAHITWRGTGPLPLSIRRRLLKRALSLGPDALISSGDHIYYDLRYGRSPKYMGMSPESIAYAGKFDESRPVLGTSNEAVLRKAVDPQIAYLYGVSCRSIPTFFLMDDHDYFENDEARAEDEYNLLDLFIGWRSPFIKKGVSFPPDGFALDLGRSSQLLYLPEFLPDGSRPADLPGSGAEDRPDGVSECYGTLRYGALVEALLFESRRYTTLTGDDAAMVHPAAEKWLVDRMAAEEATHVVNVPATIFGWSAGKWMEWYPDARNEKGSLTRNRPKYMWQQGWFNQHNRLLKAASKMDRCLPIFICGDLHSQAAGRITRSAELDLSANPVVAVATGSLGTGPRGFPSGFRSVMAEAPNDLTVREELRILEKNGFVVADFTPEKVVVSFYAWKPPDPVEAIDNLKPHHQLELFLPPAGQR